MPDRLPPVRSQVDREAIEREIRARHPLYLHVALILAFAIATALVTTKVMLTLGIDAMLVRYPIALVVAWLAFAGGVRVWLTYAGRRTRRSRSSGGLGFDRLASGADGTWSGGSTGSSGPSDGEGIRPGGGSFGGAGASGDFGAGVPAQGLAASTSTGSSGAKGSGSSGGFDLGDDGWVLLALIVLLAAIFGAAGYVIYAGPDILSDAAFSIALAGGLSRPRRLLSSGGWLAAVFRATWVPFLLVLIAALLFAAVAQHSYPDARTMRDVIRRL